MPPSPTASQAPADHGEGGGPPSKGLGPSDIIGIAVGVPSGVLAMIGVIIAFLAWRYPDKFKKTKDSLIPHRQATHDNGSTNNRENKSPLVMRDSYGGIHSNNGAPITYGRVAAMYFGETSDGRRRNEAASNCLGAFGRES